MMLRITCSLLLLTCTLALADERVRQVQEELRRRNLYFGDVDGHATPELGNALKRYQSRKGFDVTGTIDEPTAVSLGVEPAQGATVASAAQLPDVTVLRSDTARQLPEQQRIALEKQAEANVDAVPSPAPPAEAPPAIDSITPERIYAYVDQYLRDSETMDIPAQVKYFAYPVEYFDHGQVGRAFIEKDVANYVKRWPERKYVLTEPPRFVGSGREGEMTIEFPITFDVRNKKHTAHGRTRNTWTVRQEGDDLKIVAIREQRLRE